MSQNTSKEDLLIQLNTYKTQLDTVENFLKDDNENAQFLKIKQDLLQVIQLTSEVYKSLDTSNDNNDNINIEESNNNDSDNINNKDITEEEEHEDKDLNNYNTLANAPPPPSLVEESQVSAPLRTGPLQIGDVIEAIGGDRPYAGIRSVYLSIGSIYYIYLSIYLLYLLYLSIISIYYINLLHQSIYLFHVSL
jgi:hypothetical protein